MINFFKRIRQQLISENQPARAGRAGKVRKYLIYAAGEIILVMVGILLALQVNNWNVKNQERLYQLKQLSNLRLEIESMQKFLKFQISTLESAMEGTRPLLELMGPQASMNILPDSINHLIRKAVNTDFVTAEKIVF